MQIGSFFSSYVHIDNIQNAFLRRSRILRRNKEKGKKNASILNSIHFSAYNTIHLGRVFLLVCVTSCRLKPNMSEHHTPYAEQNVTEWLLERDLKHMKLKLERTVC